jgi:hypothetical protein
MSDTITTRIKLKRDTTSNWNNAVGFIPLQGEVIIYTDYQTKSWTVEEYGETVTKTVNIPGLKIGDGLAYVQDLPFVDEELREKLMNHINNMDIHVTLADKEFWNNKVNIDDSDELVSGDLVDDTLIFNRL